MNIVQAEENLKKITAKFSKDSFVFDLMEAYDFPKSTISKLKIKLKKNPEDEVIVASKLHFVGVSKKELDSKFDELITEYSTAKKAPRFIIVTDYQSLKAYDTKVAEKLDTEIKNLSKHPDFFIPWAGIEKKVFQGENPADVKAAEKLAKFFDLILKDNLKLVEKERHALNVFLTRILFCFFAEDTDIFKKGIFTESLASHTKADGSDLDDYLQRLFELLNKKSRSGLPDFLKEFPYVNGGLFAEEFPIPIFSKKSRESLIDLGSDLNWAEINPDIFGSMIQAVVHPDQRAGLGMHYTSVTNIMKVIEPLFLTELKEEFASAKGNKNKLKKLLERIGNIKIFDPACGSGNFLIIAYKELRLLEMHILKALGEIPMSGISLANFFGIEIDDFAHEVAKLSLWLAEHQMDVLFNREFGDVKASLPLKDSGKIICGNAIRTDWHKVCPTSKEEEVYVIGNPPYLGSSLQNKEQKTDIEEIFGALDNYKNLDYISCWFAKAASFIKKSNSRSAFVSTNSICQGEHVELLWPSILNDTGIEIDFGHKSFKWTNQAKNKAAVICVIIGLRNQSKSKKYIYQDATVKVVDHINAYLVDGPDIYLPRRDKPISDLPEMVYGNKPTDDGHLILSDEEKNELLRLSPEAKKYIKMFLGSSDYIQGVVRWCLWIEDKDLSDAKKIKPIHERLNRVRSFRLKSKASCTVRYADFPNRFKQRTYQATEAIIIPIHTSERRDYIPFGYIGTNVVVSNAASVIYSAQPWIFGLIISKMHMAWVKATAGRIKTDFRYSSVICYNNFPFPKTEEKTIKEINTCALKVLQTREKYSDKSLAFLYDPDTMPSDLRDAHNDLDKLVDNIYLNGKKDVDDDERLAILFKSYQQMIGRN